MEEPTLSPGSSEEWIVPRSKEVVEGLNPSVRWEVTRRHPYYLMFWEAARSPGTNATGIEMRRSQAARLMLQLTCSVGDPVAPGLSAEELTDELLESPWVEGAIAPVSIRGIATVLAGHLLPAETKRAIAGLLLRSIEIGEGDCQAEYDLVCDLSLGEYPGFNQCFPNLMVTINPRAPQRAVTRAVEQIVREYKAENGIEETRRRDDKIDDYLAVWDRREGWTGACYEGSREQRLKAISRELRLSISTVHNRYRSAFKLIVGHEYSAELWFKAVGLPKLAGRIGSGFPTVSSRRPSRKRQPREVPEALLSGDHEEPTQRDFLQNAGMRSNDLEQWELLSDIRDLIVAGRSDDQIMKELELVDGAVALISYLRGHEIDVNPNSED